MAKTIQMKRVFHSKYLIASFVALIPAIVVFSLMIKRSEETAAVPEPSATFQSIIRPSDESLKPAPPEPLAEKLEVAENKDARPHASSAADGKSTENLSVSPSEGGTESESKSNAATAIPANEVFSASPLTEPLTAGGSAPAMARQGPTQDGRPTRTLSPFRGPINVRPKEGSAKKSKRSFAGDLRSLQGKPKKDRVRFPHEKVRPDPQRFDSKASDTPKGQETQTSSIAPGMTAPAPAPINTFEALGRTGGWGNGYPPDPTGDVGPDHYVQAINTALAVYDKSGNLLAGPMDLDTFMSQGSFGNLCDTDNYGDPVVLYDTFEDRWVVTNFAFKLNAQSAVINPPGSFQCIAVSKSGDPVSGGWNYYFINRTDALNDYPKLGIWPDGIYMSANMFDMSGGFYHGVTVWALNKTQMYAGAPTVQIVSFDIGTGDFSLLPSNARLQTGTPSPGTPNYFISSWNFLNALSVYKFSVDWERISLSTFTGPDIPLSASSWPNASVDAATVPAGGSNLDTVEVRAMMQNTYTKIGGVESLWLPHTVRRANTSGSAAPRWYQVNVTEGVVAPSILQASTWDPDGNNTVHRYMPSLAVDRSGNMAMGYTASSSSLHPSIRYAGRLAADPVNTFSRTEQILFSGTGSQSGSGRWGDYSHMTLDPDGCTFWYTNEYYAATGSIYRTRVGNFKFDECTAVGSGSLQGTVTSNGQPIAGAEISLGSRKAATDAFGVYSFGSLPAGVYSKLTAARPGYFEQSAMSVTINEGSTTTQNFSVDPAPDNACLTDTSKSQFENGVPENVTITSGGDVILAAPLVLDQQNIDVLVSSGSSFTTNWNAQTFTSAVTGPAKRIDLHLYSADCSGVTMPPLTFSIRATSGNLPTGPDLATTTVAGFCNGTSKFYTANFAAPATLTAGTQYAVVWRSTLTGLSTNGNPRYISTISSGNPYAGGRRSFSTSNGSSWTLGSTANDDNGFRVFIDTGYAPSGSFVSNVKDANPALNSLPVWGNLAWTGTPLPAGTDIRLQAAASDSPFGPFDFKGPDGTANSFFVNGASLSQFDGSRYLRYKAVLSTTDPGISPALNDVNVCFANQAVATCADISIPALTSKTGVPLTVPVNVSDISGLGARSADFTINFDPDIVQPTGTAANNWGVALGSVGTSNGGGRTLTVTRPAPGTLVLSIFGVNDMQGAGALVNLNFNIVGEPMESTGVLFASFVFNEGEPCTNTSNGSIGIISGAVSGTVTFGNAGTAPFAKTVRDVNIAAAGSIPRADTTETDGTYSMDSFGAGQYTVTPSKSGDVNGAIAGFDAAAIAGHVSGVGPLANNQIIVADVSGNGTVSSFDAALVAAYAVGLPGTGSAGTWRFVPVSRVHPNMNGDQTGQNFVALLMGDVTGSWTAPPPPPAADSELTGEAADLLQIAAPQMRAAAGTTFTVPIKIGDTTGLGIRSYDFELHYDPAVLEPAEAAASVAGTVSGGRVLTFNANEKGVLKVVTFGDVPFEGEGELLNLHFNAVGVADSKSVLRWERFVLNEGGIEFKTAGGEVTVAASAGSGAINGRLLDPKGNGIARSMVTVTDTRGNSRTVMTSSLGYFQLTQLPVGETYTIRADSRRYRFAAQSVSITEGNAVELTMIGLE